MNTDITNQYFYSDEKSFPILYILMRTDVTSLNPGKAMAQASHASNAFVKEVRDIGAGPPVGTPLWEMAEKWQRSTNQGFGTVLVLDGKTEYQIIETLRKFDAYQKNANMLDVTYGLVNDPTYPIRDGDVTHYISFNTCAYVFFDKNNPVINEILSEFSLHP